MVGATLGALGIKAYTAKKATDAVRKSAQIV